MSTHALVIGKFYPLHVGHVALVHAAAEANDRVTVIVMASQFESIPLAWRVRWLEKETADWGGVHVLGVPCDAPTDYAADIAWHANVALMQAALTAAGAPPVTALFSSEPYGDRLAAAFGAVAVTFDVERRGHVVSGTAVRGDIIGRWNDVAPAARLDLATRVIVVGAESTGTTTLARDLTQHYRAHGFPAIADVEEYGRAFTYDLHAQASRVAGHDVPVESITWLPEHFGAIAREQTAREDAAAHACPLVIADTDAFATELWERRYVGPDSRAAETANEGTLPRRDVYLLTDHVGVPFEQDGWRDGEHVRADMTAWFQTELTRSGASWVLLRGAPEERLRYARTLIDALWLRRTSFSSPPWAERTVLRG